MYFRNLYSHVTNRNRLLLQTCEKSTSATTLVYLDQKQNIRTISYNNEQNRKKIKNESAKNVGKRKKPPLTHFVSIPMNHDFINKKVKEFKTDVLNNISTDIDGITESLFQKPERLHVTIGMLSLKDEEQLLNANDILKKCSTDIICPYIKEKGPIKVQIKGVEILNSNPAKTRLLYAKITDELGYLQEISNKIADYFIDNGIMEREYDTVKLHATLMNSTFRGRHRQSSGKRYPFKFDVTKIIEAHKETIFGEITFNTVHISERYRYTEDGYYFPTAKINFDDCIEESVK